MTFDELSDKADSKNKPKEDTVFGSTKLYKYCIRKIAKGNKKTQLKIQMRTLKNLRAETERALQKSLLDPNTDSVKLKVRLDRYNNELTLCKELYQQMFYSRLRIFLIKLFK